MKNVKMPEFTGDESGEEAYNRFYESVGIADWKSSPSAVLDMVDFLLESRGLEVRQFGSGSDGYMFDIIERT